MGTSSISTIAFRQTAICCQVSSLLGVDAAGKARIETTRSVADRVAGDTLHKALDAAAKVVANVQPGKARVKVRTVLGEDAIATIRRPRRLAVKAVQRLDQPAVVRDETTATAAIANSDPVAVKEAVVRGLASPDPRFGFQLGSRMD